MAKQLVDSFDIKRIGKWYNVEVYRVMEHFEVHVDGEFWCSCDNRAEVDEEVERIVFA